LCKTWMFLWEVNPSLRFSRIESPVWGCPRALRFSKAGYHWRGLRDLVGVSCARIQLRAHAGERRRQSVIPRPFDFAQGRLRTGSRFSDGAYAEGAGARSSPTSRNGGETRHPRVGHPTVVPSKGKHKVPRLRSGWHRFLECGL